MILNIEFQENRTFDVELQENNLTFDVGFTNLQIVAPGGYGVETYNGEYEVTPTPEQQVLQTAFRYMEDNVTVKSIPFFETSNQTGGNTVYIASEV